MQKLRALAAEWSLGPAGGCAEDVHMGCGGALDDLLDEIAGIPPKPSPPPDRPIDDGITVTIHYTRS